MGDDRRKVSTDALETLGSIITDAERRDAIHLAVEPVCAVEKVYPGQDVGLVPGGAGPSPNPVGIVDPFLKGPVFPGQRFWLVVYPRQIHSLRHVWTHPAFADEPGTPAEPVATVNPEESRRWLEDFAKRAGIDYDDMMYGAQQWVEGGDYLSQGGKYESARDEYWDDERTGSRFWQHYVNVTGQTVEPERRENFFSCSC